MLTIHRSERADPLVAALGAVLADPVGDPFAAEVVAVPSKGVERWLAQRLSHVLGAVDGDGVCANVEFPSYSRLLDEVAASADADYAASREVWAAPRAVWPLMRVIDRCAPTEPWCRALGEHLGLVEGGSTGARGRRFAVAAMLARHFEDYGRARPAMIRAWSAGRNEQGGAVPLPPDLLWQAELWRRLRDEIGLPAPAELLTTTCDRIADGASIDLPPRLAIFGVTRIAASRLDVLAAVARQRDVALYLPHPSPEMWSRVRAAAGSARRRRDVQTGAVNPLLGSLARDVRELQQVLDSSAGEHHADTYRAETYHPDTFHPDTYHPVPPRPDTLLGRLQDDLAADRVPVPVRLAAGDNSITVHACHGPARQVEVVRETVLGLLADDPTLEPREIVIMCPDVERFAPLVAASFGMAEESGGHPAAQLRVRLADRSLRRTNPLLSLLGSVLDLAASRVTATQVLDLAGCAPVRKLFGFDDDDIAQVRDWTSAANARWGLDATHRSGYGLGALGQGTWRAALDRLLLGVAMEEDDQCLGGVLPFDDVDSGDIDLAGRIAEFVDRLDRAVRALAQPRTVAAWMRVLTDTVLELGAPLQPWQAIQLRRELDDVAETAGETNVELAVSDVAVLLGDRLAGRPSRASFRTGTLTVCTLVPMRAVPHRVVCLLGMDDGTFPRHAITDGDDVLARDPHIGERDPRSEDRQLFLDAVCAAQDHLVITYTGADPRSGAVVPPCVPLGELLDAVDASVLSDARERVVIRHPLQPFDPRNFAADTLGRAGPFSFDPSGLAGARAAATNRHDPRPLVTAPLPIEVESTVELDELVRFLSAPMREFLRQRLQISTWQDDDEPEDALPLDMGGLPEWSVGDRLLQRRLAGMSAERCVAVESGRGDVPPGRIGTQLLARVGRTVDAVLAECASALAVEPHSVDVDVTLDNGRSLRGTVVGVRGATLLDVTYSALGAKPRLRTWVRYLALVAQTGDARLTGLTVGKGRGGARSSTLRGLDPVEARGILENLVELRDAGLRAPLPMALKTSEAYAARLLSDDNEDDAMRSASLRWRDGDYPGECSEPAHVLVLGPQPSLRALAAWTPHDDPDLRFAPLALRLWRPILSADTP